MKYFFLPDSALFWGTFSFHPGVRRLHDYKEIYFPISSFYTEEIIQIFMWTMRYRSVLLEARYCEHIGLHSRFMEYFECDPLQWHMAEKKKLDEIYGNEDEV